MEEQVLRGLLKRKREYDRYFKEREAIDNQAVSAYINIVKLAVEVLHRAEKGARESADMRKAAEEILESEFGIRRSRG
ncbi:MAG: hypothetical protein Kow0025_11910 [Thermodesulfovibrionales bacterium]